MNGNVALIDAGPLIAFYNKGDKYHQQVWNFLEACPAGFQLITTDACITEAMYALGRSMVQQELARDISDGIWQRHSLKQEDFHRIGELFEQYQNLTADFADLSLVVTSERLMSSHSDVTLDTDFDVYRRFRSRYKPFERRFRPAP